MAKQSEQPEGERPGRPIRRTTEPQPINPAPPTTTPEEEEDEAEGGPVGTPEPPAKPPAGAAQSEPEAPLSDAECVAYLRQVQARVVFFRRNDGVERVKASCEGGNFAYEAEDLAAVTALLKARVERYCARRLPRGRR